MSFQHPIVRRSVLAASVALAAVPLFVAPTASSAPAYDDQGYLESTARCAAPDRVVVFGSTASSRIAICRDSDGDYEYRGVRVRDGARLITSATQTSDGAFVATNDGIEYSVTARALVVSLGEKVLRDEQMTDFHRADGSTPTAQEPDASPSPPATRQVTPTPTTPLPPPLPAEVGGGDGG